ncbi:MAG: flagellar assembly protein FliX [Rickettsiales bacterium]
MKITEYGTIRSASDLKRRKVGSTSSSSFADLLDATSDAGSADSVSALSDISPTAPLDNMLAMQEVSDEEIARKKLIQNGNNIIEELEKLRQQLLIGEVPLSTLRNLNARLSVQKQSVSDPHLLSLMDDIELRAAVELAKLEKARIDAGNT